jgi:DNA-binding GntR family transcriptional regulator
MLPISLGERLRLGIEADILQGRLAPGDLLDEQSLASRYKVSRTPVREALLQLSAQGLVSLIPRQPTRVAVLDATTLLEMIDVMSCLEAQAARLAARRMTTAQREQLMRIQEQAQAIANAHDVARFNDANWNLHLAIFEGSQNNYLASQARLVRLRLQPYRCLLLRLGDRMHSANAEHGQLVCAIVEGDSETAFNVMRDHLTLTADQITDLLSLMSSRTAGERLVGEEAALPTF